MGRDTLPRGPARWKARYPSLSEIRGKSPKGRGRALRPVNAVDDTPSPCGLYGTVEEPAGGRASPASHQDAGRRTQDARLRAGVLLGCNGGAWQSAPEVAIRLKYRRLIGG